MRQEASPTGDWSGRGFTERDGRRDNARERAYREREWQITLRLAIHRRRAKTSR